MPTRGAAASASKRASTSRVPPPVRRAPSVGGDGGGQSAGGQPEMLTLEPAATGGAAPTASDALPQRSLPASGFALGASGQTGKRAGCRTGRRRMRTSGADEGRTGDIAHLAVPREYFAFVSPRQVLFSLFLRLRVPAPAFPGRLLPPPQQRHETRWPGEGLFSMVAATAVPSDSPFWRVNP
jgi:hypothetical protein